MFAIAHWDAPNVAPLSRPLGEYMTYKKSMLYGVLALGLAQTLLVLYGYLFNSLNKLGEAAVPISILVIFIVAIFGAIPGAILHLLKSKLPKVSALLLGFIIFLVGNTIGYVSADEIKESIIEIIFSSVVYGLCGIFMGFLYSKQSSKQASNGIT